MSISTSTYGDRTHSGPVPLAAVLPAAGGGPVAAAAPPFRVGSPATGPRPQTAQLPNVTQPVRPVPAFRAAAGAVAAAAPAPRPNKLGLFGMVSEECLARIRDHVAPIKGLHPWTAQAVYTALAVCASKQGQASVADGQRCWVTVAELAARTGMCRRNVERYLPVLEAAGVLTIVHAHDALHRPVASQFLFTYPHTESGDTVTPESGRPVAPVAHDQQPTTRESVGPDSRVGTNTKNQEIHQESGPDRAQSSLDRTGEQENLVSPEPLHLRHGNDDDLSGVDCVDDETGGADDEVTASTDEAGAIADARWQRALERLRQTTSAASFRAWIHTLVPVVSPVLPAQAVQAVQGGEPPGAAPAVLVLACPSAFHRERVEREHRRAIEVALGLPIELVVAEA